MAYFDEMTPGSRDTELLKDVPLYKLFLHLRVPLFPRLAQHAIRGNVPQF